MELQSLKQLKANQEAEQPQDAESLRARVAAQFLESELDYWLNLQNCFKLFFRPLAAKVPELLSFEELSALFFNLEKIFLLHGRFFPVLKKRVMEWEHGACMGDLLLSFLMQKEVQNEYFQYCNHMADSMLIYNELYTSSEEFRDLMNELVSEQTQWNFLTSFLQLPALRLQAYGRWLHKLLSKTPAGHGDFDFLNDALELHLQIISITFDVDENALGDANNA